MANKTMCCTLCTERHPEEEMVVTGIGMAMFYWCGGCWHHIKEWVSISEQKTIEEGFMKIDAEA